MQREAGEPGSEMPASGPAAPGRDLRPEADEAFAEALLRALFDMAARSTRRQADVAAAVRGAGLPAEPAQVRAALRALRDQGCVENLVPLSDGGLLLSVTPAAIDRLGKRPQLLPLTDDA